MQLAEAPQRGVIGGTPLLILRGIGKTFSNGVTALRDADLTLGEGDFVSLLGPSGCGKSTALRIIAGLSTPTSGLLDWRGGASTGRSNIGFVFQEPTLMPWANVFDNVWLPLRLKGVSRAKAAPAVMEMLARVHQYAVHGKHGIEHGQRVRKPAIIVIDVGYRAIQEMPVFPDHAHAAAFRNRSFHWSAISMKLRIMSMP